MSSRYEILPFGTAEAEVAAVARPLTITVTCSPRHGVDRTVGLATAIAALGHRAIPHIAARTIRSAEHLDTVLDRLQAAGLDEIFLVAGDSPRPEGPFPSAVTLLPLLAVHPARPARIGIGAYPEGHPLIDPETLRDALASKARDADYIVTQMCFDPAALRHWIAELREAGNQLPLYVGLPGEVDRRHLLEVSMRVGVGTSISFLRKQHGLRHLFGRPHHAAEHLHAAFAPLVGDAALHIAGLHYFTFNRLQATLDWEAELDRTRQELAAMLDALAGGHLMTQLAACERAAGVALVPYAPLLELRGPAGQLPPAAARWGWWQRASAHRCLVLADVRTRDQFDTLRGKLARWAPDVALVDRSAGHACVVLTGPLAPRLALAGARHARLVACDGDQHRVLVVPASEAEAVQCALLDAGRGDGVVAVDARATDLLRAARHAAHTTLPLATGAQRR